MNSINKNFQYLNAENCWPDFRYAGLELLDDGSLQLSVLPRLIGTLPPDIPVQANMAGGIVTDWDGTIYISIPDEQNISPPKKKWIKRIQEDGSTEFLEFADTSGGEWESIILKNPHGLCIDQAKHQLLIADSGNNCIRIFNINSSESTFEIDLTIGGAGSAAGQFDFPTELVFDSNGNLFVVNSGNRRVQKLGQDKKPLVEFQNALESSGLLSQPTHIAINENQSESCIYIFDEDHKKVFIFDLQGNARFQFEAGEVSSASGMVATDRYVYIGDNNKKSIQVYQNKSRDFEYAGTALGYAGSVVSMTLQASNLLTLYPVTLSDGTLFFPRFYLDGGYRTKGLLISREIGCGEIKHKWQHLKAEIESSSQHGHFQIFAFLSDKKIPAYDLNKSFPFSEPGWKPLPVDLNEGYIGETEKYLTIGILFTGDSTASIKLKQLRIDFDNDSYLSYLPPIYTGSDESPQGFLPRLLALFQSHFDDMEAQTASLPKMFDPEAISDDALPWLANWLALPLRNDFIRYNDESELDYTKRLKQENLKFLALAKTLGSYRGTSQSLYLLLKQWMGNELDNTDTTSLLITDLTSNYYNADTVFQLMAQVGVTTFLGEAPPFYFIVELVPNPNLIELRNAANIEIFIRAARYLIDGEKPAHTQYELKLRAKLMTMRLMPEKLSDRQPGEIYAQIGETTMLWDDD